MGDLIEPIERDEAMDRTYIPLPGGWEVQTKGNGSTFRICDPKGDRMPITGHRFEHEEIERMARDIHAEWQRLTDTLAARDPMFTFVEEVARGVWLDDPEMCQLVAQNLL